MRDTLLPTYRIKGKASRDIKFMLLRADFLYWRIPNCGVPMYLKYAALIKSACSGSVAPFVSLSNLDWNAGGSLMVVPRFYSERA